MELCALAADEQNSERLLALTQEIAPLLDEKEKVLKNHRLSATEKPAP
jgi:hypothetical protein